VAITQLTEFFAASAN